MSLIEQTRKFAVGELVTLFELDLTAQGGSRWYFTSTIFEERVPIQFDGETYTQLPIQIEDLQIDAQAGPPQPRLTVATAGGPVTSLISQYKDLRGAKLWRRKTFSEFLDIRPDGSGGTEVNPGADPSALLQNDLFIVDRKQGSNNTFAEFVLVAPTDQEGVELPLRIVRKRWCDALYRKYEPGVVNTEGPDDFFNYIHAEGGCPFRGSTYFDENDQPTTQANDRCSKLVSGCTLRFGNTVALPFSGFPGIRASEEA